MMSSRCPTCVKVLGVIQVLLIFEAKLALIFLEQGKPISCWMCSGRVVSLQEP